ncbi:M20/M25/M40 family metallo-hydrolase [Thermodesulfobacterium sp. TA1]|uniref:M20/M25/M40 family metallo-hydrolase n=1 Tax=Thermodesulfobacterium sp. TA1 TaxID=2234087 RepID=UPI0012329320|nr:M20/M25/M40 family metallo-hydrolase [Thermodesulfobacterium sp. TA1]QER42504.1 M20/M25/M40 family metallo-hydrolase [Thermodesulfobacterium sp. TA1]
MIDVDRLVLEFSTLLSIESPSKKEGKLAHYLADIFEALGYRCFFDKSAENTGSEVGNLIVKIPGAIPASPVFFCAHLDTVGPCENPKIIFENGVFKTDGRTILGADDKSGIAVLVELAKVLKENSIPHPPLEFIFTTCEEIGLLGAKFLDLELIDAKEGYVLDSENPEVITIGAPSSYKFKIKVKGKAAHAGLEPEKGVNAIYVLSQVLSKLTPGRIDQESTMNIGIVSGGKYVNIVPETAEAEGEIRSHNPKTLEKMIQQIENLCLEVESSYQPKVGDLPKLSVSFEKLYQAFFISLEDSILEPIKQAGKRLRLNLSFMRKEGGSDANIFNERGKKAVILGTGMQKVHTTEEFILVKDLVKAAQLVLEIVKAKGEAFR